MSASSPKTLGKDLEIARHGVAHKAIDRAISDLKDAAEAGRTDADAMLSAATTALAKAAATVAEETRRRSSTLTKLTAEEVREHPVVTTAIGAALLATIAGVILAIRQAPRKLLK